MFEPLAERPAAQEQREPDFGKEQANKTCHTHGGAIRQRVQLTEVDQPARGKERHAKNNRSLDHVAANGPTAGETKSSRTAPKAKPAANTSAK